MRSKRKVCACNHLRCRRLAGWRRHNIETGRGDRRSP